MANSTHVYPPRRGDPRIVEFISNQGGSSTGDINRDFAEALALALGFTAAQRNEHTIDDLWKRYKVANGLEDTSEPFSFPGGGVDNYLLENGGIYLLEDGSAILME